MFLVRVSLFKAQYYQQFTWQILKSQYNYFIIIFQELPKTFALLSFLTFANE